LQTLGIYIVEKIKPFQNEMVLPALNLLSIWRYEWCFVDTKI